MSTVKVLIDGVGEWKAGEIVKNAPVGLVDMATKGTRNAATGELIAVLVEDAPPLDVEALKAKAKDLNIPGYWNMKPETLAAAVEAAEADKQSGGTTTPPANQNATSGAVTDDAKQDSHQ